MRAELTTGQVDGRSVVELSGDWTLNGLPQPVASLQERLAAHTMDDPTWDLSGVM